MAVSSIASSGTAGSLFVKHSVLLPGVDAKAFIGGASRSYNLLVTAVMLANLASGTLMIEEELLETTSEVQLLAVPQVITLVAPKVHETTIEVPVLAVTQVITVVAPS